MSMRWNYLSISQISTQERGIPFHPIQQSDTEIKSVTFQKDVGVSLSFFICGIECIWLLLKRYGGYVWIMFGNAKVNKINQSNKEPYTAR